MLELIRFAFLARLRSTLIWGVSVGLVAGATLATYAVFDAGQMEQMVNAMPKELLEAFGSDPTAYTRPEGYLGTELGSYLPAVIAFFMISGAAHAIAGAEQEGTLDVVLSQPVPRWWVPVSAFLAGTAGMVVVALLYAVFLALCSLLAGIALPARAVVESAISLVPIAMVFGALAVVVSARLRRTGAVTGTVGAVLVVTYIGNTIALLVDDLSWMRWLSPFHYYGSPFQEGLVASDVLVLLAASAVLIAASVPLFMRRDVQV